MTFDRKFTAVILLITRIQVLIKNLASLKAALVHKGRSPIKNGKIWEFFPSRASPLPPVWECHICEDLRNSYCWGVSHVKNSKKWKWDSGRPTPVFQNFHIFLFKPACSNLLTAAKYRLHLRVIYAALVWAVTTIKVQRKPDHAGNGFGLRLLLQDSSNWLVRY